MDKGMEMPLSQGVPQAVAKTTSTIHISDENVNGFGDVFSKLDQKEVPQQNTPIDFRTGPDAAKELIKEAKEDGPRQTLRAVATGEAFKHDTIKKIEDDDLTNNVSETLRRKEPVANEDTNHEPFNLRRYNQIRKEVYEEKARNGEEVDWTMIDQEAELKYFAEKENEGKDSMMIKLQDIPNFKYEKGNDRKNEKEPTFEELMKKDEREFMKYVTPKLVELLSKAEKNPQDHEKMQELALLLFAYSLMKEGEKKGEKEPTFIELLIQILNKIITEFTKFDQEKSGVPADNSKPQSIKALQMPDKNAEKEDSQLLLQQLLKKAA